MGKPLRYIPLRHKQANPAAENARLRALIYRKPFQHEVGMPRLGDLAEVTKSCCAQYSGMLVQVTGDPHLMQANCSDCGQKTMTHMVEIHTSYEGWRNRAGPWFMPVEWLKRIDPKDPVNYPRMLKYVPNPITLEHLHRANPNMGKLR